MTSPFVYLIAMSNLTCPKLSSSYPLLCFPCHRSSANSDQTPCPHPGGLLCFQCTWGNSANFVCSSFQISPEPTSCCLLCSYPAPTNQHLDLGHCSHFQSWTSRMDFPVYEIMLFLSLEVPMAFYFIKSNNQMPLWPVSHP